jgi:hypothetical protein
VNPKTALVLRGAEAPEIGCPLWSASKRPVLVPGIFSIFQSACISTTSLIPKGYTHMVTLLCARNIYIYWNCLRGKFLKPVPGCDSDGAFLAVGCVARIPANPPVARRKA